MSRRTDIPSPADDAAEETPWLQHPVSREGVDLTQIRALRALSPTERVRVLVDSVNRLQRLRSRVRRV